MKIDWNYWIIGVLAAVFFLPFLGGVHLFDWDEINFAECSREMILRGEYLRPQINFQPFWEKPPIFMWLQSLSMHIFGVNEYAARFPNAICGIVTLLIVYHLGKTLYDKAFGWLWTLSYIGSILPHLYFKSGIIDPWFNLFIFLSLVFWIKNDEQSPLTPKGGTPANESLEVEIRVNENGFQFLKYKYLALAGIFAGLAILTKGPAGFLIIALTIFCKLLIYKELRWIKIKQFVLFSIIAFMVTMLWFGIETLKNGFWFIQTFIEYNIRLAKTEDAGHGGFPGYHFVVIFFGCFPASIFALRALYKRYNFFNENVDFTRWMKVLFWVVIILFSIVQSKIVHYSSMCYLPLTFLSAITLKNIIEDGFFFPFKRILLIAVGSIIGLIVIAVPFVGQHISILKSLFQSDIFALKNLDAPIKWSGLEAIAGFLILFNVFFFIFTLKNVKILRGVSRLFIGTAIFVNLVLFFFINNIEGYSQNAAIEFYIQKSTEDCYVTTFGYKSYAHLFYTKKQIPTNPNHADNEWLMRGAVDKPTYWVAKYSAKAQLDTVSTLQYLYDKNGFVFYQRK